jgi:acid phosphatase type 7
MHGSRRRDNLPASVVIAASVSIAAICAVLAGLSVAEPERDALRADRNISLAVLGDVNHPGNSSTRSREGRLASSIAAYRPTAIAMLGDYQYPYGTCAQLVRDFDRTGWGALMPRFITTAGPTHDYTSTPSSATDYSRHMEGRCPGQRSGRTLSARRWHRTIQPFAPHYVDLGAWTVVSMPSGQWRSSYANAYSARYAGARLTRWLTRTLAAARSRGDHVVVMEHEPYWSSGSEEHGSSEGDAQRPWIDALDRYDVRLVLAGHQHNYERFYPQLANGARNDATGTQQFQVSTGGIELRRFTWTAPNSAVRNSTTFGWLRLVLHPDGSYTWGFVPTQGSFTDSGSRPAS